jgi:pimeloyl-ACP methyl ester carboxylesterase
MISLYTWNLCCFCPSWGLFRGVMPLAILPDNQLRDKLKAVFEEVTPFDVEERLKEIQVPTLVVGGRHDVIVPVEESIAIYKGIQNSNLLLLEHSGHGPEGADEDRFSDTVLHFLSELKT